MIALREVLGRLDNAHGELVYATLYFRYIQTGIFEQIDASKIIYLPSGIRIWKGTTLEFLLYAYVAELASLCHYGRFYFT